MSLGLGHNYCVRIVQHHYGDLLSCLDFMENCCYDSKLQWFELRPEVKVLKGVASTTGMYSCDLVEDWHTEIMERSL